MIAPLYAILFGLSEAGGWPAVGGNAPTSLCDIASGRHDSHLVNAVIARGGVQLPPAVQRFSCPCG